MGIFDFLKKKKDDDLDDLGDLGGDLGPEPAFPGSPNMNTGGMPGLPQGNTGAPQLFSNQPMPPPPGIPSQMQGPTPISMNFSQPMQGQQGSGHVELLASRIEVISSKIDSLRTSMERLNEKLDYIERFLAASGGGRRYG